jgi:hypothetical protein
LSILTDTCKIKNIIVESDIYPTTSWPNIFAQESHSEQPEKKAANCIANLPL